MPERTLMMVLPSIIFLHFCKWWLIHLSVMTYSLKKSGGIFLLKQKTLAVFRLQALVLCHWFGAWRASLVFVFLHVWNKTYIKDAVASRLGSIYSALSLKFRWRWCILYFILSKMANGVLLWVNSHFLSAKGNISVLW